MHHCEEMETGCEMGDEGGKVHIGVFKRTCVSDGVWVGGMYPVIIGGGVEGSSVSKDMLNIVQHCTNNCMQCPEYFEC